MEGTSDSLLLIVADGVVPNALAAGMDAGELPSLEGLRASGGLHTVTTAFPSVTGPAYLPFLMGRHPAPIGMPGLRWFDRSRSIPLSIGNARSYSGIDIWRTHGDVHADVPTLFELARPSLASMSIFARGTSVGHIGRSIEYMVRSAVPHFGGRSSAWRDLEVRATSEFFRRFRKHRPRFATLVLNAPDKFAHRFGTSSTEYSSSLRDVDSAVATAELIASADGWRERLAIWVVSDHGHSPVDRHDDLHAWIESRGHRVIAHPKLRTRNADVALMVGGNAMAHVYVEPATRERQWWADLGARWQVLHDALVERDSVGLAAVGVSATRTRVTSARGGTADILLEELSGQRRWSYVALDGDPLGLGGSQRHLDHDDAWAATANTDFPDALVQLSHLAGSMRSGDIVLSAARGWDLRNRFEPVLHVSTHGALLREQMLVPLLLDRPVLQTPRRTTDIMPSALRLLGIASSAEFDGESFL
jgi:hypothetical protein